MTDSYTSPWVLANSTDPERAEDVDWPTRRANALIQYDVVDGQPIHPFLDEALALHGPAYGRNDMKNWAENVMGDVRLTATFNDRRWVALIKRSDNGTWAMPGGGADDGELPADCAMREMHEEIGLHYEESRYGILDADGVFYPIHSHHVSAPVWIRDRRGSRQAWAVSTIVSVELGRVMSLPTLASGTDAVDAIWWPVEEVVWGVRNTDKFLHSHRAHLETLT